MAPKSSSKRIERKASGVRITERRLLTQSEYDSIVSAGRAAEVLLLFVKQPKGPKPEKGHTLTNAERQQRFRERLRFTKVNARKNRN